MRNLYEFVIFGILTVAPMFVIPRYLEVERPVIKLYEVDENNNIIRLYDRVDNYLSEVIVENLDHLRLECQSNSPVQWIYTGNGVPILSSNIALSTNREKRENVKLYTASALLSPIEEHHTGTYQCSQTEYVTLSPNVHIYVPGPYLFSSLHGKTIQIWKNDSIMSIPCSVSHPRVQVSLQKFDNKGFRIPVSELTAIYDPRKGFLVNLKKLADPEGTYICKARYKEHQRDIIYFVTSQAPVSEPKPAPIIQKECEKHSDCPSLMRCYTDYQCRDPCSYSIRCGKNSNCRIINNVPECYCPLGFVGNATIECTNF